ncbi:MAG: DUF2332 family protein [Devosia sp.]
MPTGTPLEQLEEQAKASDRLGSPFTARLCRLLGQRLDRSTAFGARILDWPGDAFADNVALRACGAIHALARSGDEPRLTAAYPPSVATADQLWAAFADALPRHDAFLTEWLSSAPQTNEVARSALILGGMLHIADAARLPLEILEVGASAGLNLAFDQYRYALGEGRVWGRADAPLLIDCPWRGPSPPLDAPLRVVARAGSDLRPIDATSAVDRERLLSYVWADQQHRLERVETALALAAAEHRTIDRADAAEWVESKLRSPRPPGTTRVLYHTIVWDYLPAATKARIDAAVASAAATATTDAPFARLTIESDEIPGSARIAITVWPTGITRTLGRGDFHGRWAEWT